MSDRSDPSAIVPQQSAVAKGLNLNRKGTLIFGLDLGPDDSGQPSVVTGFRQEDDVWLIQPERETLVGRPVRRLNAIDVDVVEPQPKELMP